MSKYWGLIAATRPHIFSLGTHDELDKAMAFAQEFCDKKNKENREKDEAENVPENQRRPEYDLMWILDDDEMRSLTGEIHRPYAIAKPKREEVSVEAPVRRGGAAPVVIADAGGHVCEDGGDPCAQYLENHEPADASEV